MTLYDELPWKGQPIAGTAPEQLAVASWAWGGPCPRVRGARVLELGCGDGANLVPMAWHRRDCTFVGVDASAVHIASATRAVDALAVDNVRLELDDLREADLGDEPFDFIVAHGLLSWVSVETRAHLFALIRRHLAPDGVAYVSFNARPGWALRGVVRDLLRHGTRRSDPPRARAAAARALAAALRGLADETLPGALLLAGELARIERVQDAELVHEYLADDNHPLWIGTFVDEAAAAGLRHVGEARGDPDDALAVRTLTDRVQTAGCVPSHAVAAAVDALEWRPFRRAVLCHADAADATAEPTVASGLARDEAADRPGGPAVFRGRDDLALEISDAGLATTLRILADGWPAGRTIADLVTLARRLGISADSDALRGQFLDLYRAGQVELRLREPPCRLPVGDTPVACALSRFESEAGATWTTPFHIVLPTEPAERELVRRLDGRPLAAAAAEAGLAPDEAGSVVERLGWWGLLEPPGPVDRTDA